MSNKMYVGNLPYTINEADLREAFSQFGAVSDVAVMMDRETNRPRGFAFVAMDTAEAMEAAVRGLDGQDFQGRKLVVNEARPRENNGGGGGGGYGGGGGGGGGYGGGGGGGRRDDKRGGGGYAGGGGGNRGGGGRW